MIKSESKITVRYSETDQMGFVYYGNYPQYLEIGRVEALKSIGLSYRAIEEQGYALPVKDLVINYKVAANYDDELTIQTFIHEKPTNKIIFDYKIFRGETLLIEAKTTLFFIDVNKKACRPPAFFLEKIKPYFS